MGERFLPTFVNLKSNTMKKITCECMIYKLGTFSKYYKISQLIHTQNVAN